MLGLAATPPKLVRLRAKLADVGRARYAKLPMPNYYLNSYAPLVASAVGRLASRERGIPPFVDGSIRREPDLEHELPAISCLCRADKFAPRLRVGDTVAYMTRKAAYGTGAPHRRLTAVLLVRSIFESHQDAAEWYREQGMALPNNCMVPGNSHKPLEHSHRLHEDRSSLNDEKLCRRWDGQYRLRASRYGSFVVCHKLFCDLTWDSPIADEDDFFTAFGRVPGTRNPGTVPRDEFLFLMELLDVDIQPSAP